MGREILRGLSADESVAAVHVLGRRDPGVRHSRLTFHPTDFSHLPALPPLDEVYLALGTTIRVAGSQQAFRAIDLDASLAVARAARAAGARRLGLVSAMGADPHSSVFYNRVKGELEAALAGLGFDGLVIARPSLLAGDRRALGQPERTGERIGVTIGRVLGGLLPTGLRPIEARKVAAALLATVPPSSGLRVLSSGDMQHMAPPCGHARPPDQPARG